MYGARTDAANHDMSRRLSDDRIDRVLGFARDEIVIDEPTVEDNLSLPFAFLVDDRFEVQDVLGKGGSAVVHRARDRRTGLSVALKTTSITRERDLARLSREVAALSALRHPGIVGYHGHGRLTPSSVYVAMDLLEGETLATRLLRGPLAPDEATILLEKLADALGAAHDAGIVHRDVKPSNVLLVDGRVDRLRLLDFGLARPTACDSRITSTGTFIGTPGYAAPEQVRHASGATAASDVFALGVTVFEAVAGASPFAAPTSEERLIKSLTTQPESLAIACPHASPLLARVIDSMLAKEPRARPADGNVVLAAIDPTRAPSDKPPSSALDQGVYRGTCFSRKDGWSTAQLAAIDTAVRRSMAVQHPLALVPREVITSVEQVRVVLPHPEGPTLGALLLRASTGRSLPPLAAATSIALDVIEALTAAHRTIVSGMAVHHGQVLPRFVCIDGSGAALLGGFFAHALPRKVASKDDRWVAPEQRLNGIQSEASDVFGAAALFIRAIVPWLSGPERARGLTAMRPDLPDVVTQALLRALDQAPRRRGTLAELRRALLCVAGDSDNLAGRSSVLQWTLSLDR